MPSGPVRVSHLSSPPPHWLRTFSIFFALATSQGPSRHWQAYNWEIIPSYPPPFSKVTASADTNKDEPAQKLGLCTRRRRRSVTLLLSTSYRTRASLLIARRLGHSCDSLIPCPRIAFCTATLHSSRPSYRIVLDMRVAGLQLEVANPQLSCVSKHPGRAFKTKLRAEMGVWLSVMCCACFGVFRRVLVTTQT